MIRSDKKTGRHYVYVAGANGKRRYVGAFGSRKDALQAEQEHAVTQRKIASGELPADLDLDRTVKQAMEAWFKSLELQGSRSLKTYRHHMHYIEPHLGPVPIARLTKSQLLAWRDKLASKFAPKTVNVTLAMLSSAFRHFIDCGWAAANPCRGVKRLEVPDGVYTWIRTREEMTKLLVECPKGVREVVAVALGTGMRIDEVLHLHWADVDIERRLITVHRGRQGTVKSGKSRWVPILDPMLPFLRELALKRGGAELVFPVTFPKAKKGGKMITVRSKAGITTPFKQAVVRAGLPKALRFHDLRHTFASHWVLNGGDIFRLSRALGHATVLITQKFYAHLAPEAWEQDYRRVLFVVPGDDVVYGITRRNPAAGDKAEPARNEALRAV
ncbi:MAG TPA: tyrosine-type recombinase/integrase [Polyangiales bacterium]|nr:tyrosine-type recombinase/integrase [Polyangiales bacterium]